MVDVNGNYLYSKTIMVEATTGHVIAVFPNPVKDELFIRLPDGLPESVIRIVDTKGSTVGRLQMEAGITAISINTDDLPPGAYSLIFDSGKLKETIQFIKE